MNYLSSLTDLLWSDSSTTTDKNQSSNNQQPQIQYNIQRPPSSQYVSPLSSLQPLDHKEDTQSSSPSIASQASAFFAGWRNGSPAAPSPKAKTLTHKKPNTFSINQHFQNSNVHLPSMTSHAQINNILPPSYPSAVSVTSNEPIPIIKANATHQTNRSRTTSNASSKSQVKFTPKYKKMASIESDHSSNHNHQHNATPFTTSTHANVKKNMNEMNLSPNMENINESDHEQPMDESTHYKQSTLTELVESKQLNAALHAQESENHNQRDSMDIDSENEDENDSEYQRLDTPPPRAPNQFHHFKTQISNESDFEQDIVKPHAGYNNKSALVHSETNILDTDQQIAVINNSNSSMVSLLMSTGYSEDENVQQNDKKQTKKNKLSHFDSDKLLAPMSSSLNHSKLPQLSEYLSSDNETNEVQLHYNKKSNTEPNANQTLLSLYGMYGNKVDNDDTKSVKSVFSDFEEAEFLLKQDSMRQESKKKNRKTKIRVTCNNCYLWRHHTNKLQIENANLLKRKQKLEKDIDEYQNKQQMEERRCQELIEENERLKSKINELKSQMATNKEEATDVLIEARKKLEEEIQSQQKEYQNLMKTKHELETRCNELVKSNDIKDSEIEKLKSEVHSVQIKQNRLDVDILQERVSVNLREKSFKSNLNSMNEKYLNLLKEKQEITQELMAKHNEDEALINELSEEAKGHKLKISQLSQENDKLSSDLDAYKRNKVELHSNYDKMEEEWRHNLQKLNEATNQIRNLEANEKKLRSELLMISKNDSADDDDEIEESAEMMQLKYSELQSQNDEIGQKMEELQTETIELQTKYKQEKAQNDKMENELNEWKAKYKQLNEKLSQNQTALNAKEIEYNFSKKESERVLNDYNKYKEKTKSIYSDLQTSENEVIALNEQLNSLRDENESKQIELRQKVNNLEDKLTEISDENTRLQTNKDKSSEQLNEREEQLKASNAENDKLMDKNWELNEKLNKSTQQMEEYKNKLDSIQQHEEEKKEELLVVTSKLQKAETERNKQLKKNVVLNNRVKSLQEENAGLQDSIHHLENIIDDTYGDMTDKERRLAHLRRKNNENELSLNKIKNRMKKSNRQMNSYRQLELDAHSKTHRKMDQKLDMVRKSNMQLKDENDELTHSLTETKRELQDLKSQLKDKKIKFKATVSKYESDISQMIAKNNKLLSDKLEREDTLEQVKEESNKLCEQLKDISDKYDELNVNYQNYKIKTIQNGLSHDVKARQYLIELDIANDELFQFINRCRNIFINTNKLTPKLIMQLIESCNRSLISFHQSKAKFAQFIAKCDNVHQIFENLQTSIEQKYTNTGLLIYGTGFSLNTVSTANTKSSLNTNSKKKRNRATSDAKTKNKNNVKLNMKFCVSRLRQPIQYREPPHHSAYKQVHLMSIENVNNAKNALTDIGEMYQRPLDYASYDEMSYIESDNELNLDDDEVEIVIDYDKLLIDPRSERYESEQMIKNHDRFIASIEKFKKSSKELRAIDTRIKVQLDVALQSYELSMDDDDTVQEAEEEEEDGANSDDTVKEHKIVVSRMDLTPQSTDTDLSDSGSLNRMSLRNSLNIMTSSEDEQGDDENDDSEEHHWI